MLLKIPRALLQERNRQCRGQGRGLDSRDARAPALRNYAAHLLSTDVESDPALVPTIGDHLLDLVALSLGSGGDPAGLARKRGVRAARLRDVLREIELRFTAPAFSLRNVAFRLGVSTRYINDLLQETGATFTERVRELRLQKAGAMLTDRRHDRLRISEIAAAAGFNDSSYFNRCFRRFGGPPAEYRGGRG